MGTALRHAGGRIAQGTEQGQAIASSDVLSQISMFNYREGPKSDLYFRGTPIAATAEGRGRVEYQDGNAQISANVKKLPEPASLGPYTAYVLWALTPDGRASNQGVPASSIGVAGLGQSRPIGDNSTSDGRARNRRVEIVISGGPLAAR